MNDYIINLFRYTDFVTTLRVRHGRSFTHLLYMKPTQITVNAIQCKTALCDRRFIGSCRASLASNAAPLSYKKTKRYKRVLNVTVSSKVNTRKCSLK